MTYHINAPEYVCKKCDEIYMAYRKDLPCPSCGEPEVSQGEAYDFIDKVIRSIFINRRQFRTFSPQAWYQGSYSDYIQSICFKILDHIDENPKDNLEDLLVKQEWSSGTQKYIFEMISEVKSGYTKQNTFGEKLKQKYASLLARLLP